MMSKYTTELRYICETNTSHPIAGNGFNNVGEIINSSHTNIFNFDYPIFDNRYRSVLEKKILLHYYTREISEETVGLWKLRLCDKLNLIMPYYNQLYESALIDFDPLVDVNYTRHKKLDKTGNNNITTHENRNKDYTDNTVKDYTDNTAKNYIDNTAKNYTDYTAKNYTDSAIKDYTDYTAKDYVDNSIDNKNRNGNESVAYTDYDNKDINSIESGINNLAKNEAGVEQNNSTESKNDTENYNKSGSKNGTNRTETDGIKYRLYSDTPQGSLTGVENETYLTNVTKDIDSGSTNDNSTSETFNEQNTNTKQGHINKNDNITKANDTNSVETNHISKTDNEVTNKTGNKTVENTDNSVDTGYKSGNSTNTNTGNSTDTNTGNSTDTNTGNSTDINTGHSTNANTGNSTNTNTGNVKNVNDSFKEYGFNTTDEYVDTITGKRGSYSFSKMILDFRQTFVNIDKMIIEELSDLFFGLWE